MTAAAAAAAAAAEEEGDDEDEEDDDEDEEKEDDDEDEDEDDEAHSLPALPRRTPCSTHRRLIIIGSAFILHAWRQLARSLGALACLGSG